ncbi:MAG: hypothetical protein AB1546_01860, partial [bacterium]
MNIRDKINRWLSAVLAMIILFICGCGGGVGTTPGTPGGTPSAQGKTVNIKGAFQRGGAPDAAARTTPPAVANKSVIAYFVKDSSRKLLNSASDRTDANGNFNINVDVGAKPSLDIIVEALEFPAGSNINLRIAFDNLASDTSGAIA